MKEDFRSFWMAGFECADLLNVHGDRVDLLNMSGHLDLIYEDYERVRSLGIQTVREGIRWSAVEYLPYRYNFEAVIHMMNAARATGVQQIWDICHFGYPVDLTPLHPHFTARFVAVCKAFVACYVAQNPAETFYVTPINEVSFISWLGGEAGATVPYCTKSGWEVKYALMRAYIAAVRAMKEMSADVRIVTTEPLVNMVTSLNPSDGELVTAYTENELQYQSVDMLCGRICPELGGSEDLVDIIGFNYYYNNQWIIGSYEFLGWNDPVPDPRWKVLSDLLQEAYLRYGKPFILAETSHPKEDRPLWINMIATECAKLIELDLPLLGACIYPIIDRPDWDHPDTWHHAGLWDNDGSGKSARVLHHPSVAALRAGQNLIALKLAKVHHQLPIHL